MRVEVFLAGSEIEGGTPENIIVDIEESQELFGTEEADIACLDSVEDTPNVIKNVVVKGVCIYFGILACLAMLDHHIKQITFEKK